MCLPSGSVTAGTPSPEVRYLPLGFGLGLPLANFLDSLLLVFMDGLQGCRVEPHAVFGMEAGQGEKLQLAVGKPGVPADGLASRGVEILTLGHEGVLHAAATPFPEQVVLGDFGGDGLVENAEDGSVPGAAARLYPSSVWI